MLPENLRSKPARCMMRGFLLDGHSLSAFVEGKLCSSQVGFCETCVVITVKNYMTRRSFRLNEKSNTFSLWETNKNIDT